MGVSIKQREDIKELRRTKVAGDIAIQYGISRGLVDVICRGMPKEERFFAGDGYFPDGYKPLVWDNITRSSGIMSLEDTI